MVDALYVLALEYLESAGKQEQIIRKLTVSKKHAVKMGNYSELRELNSALARTYEIRNELLETAAKLKNYYSKGS